jgi:ribosomal protein S18 acetylase RimI-like enzyme
VTYTIRDATDDDLPVIKRVLYEAVAWDPSSRLPPMEAVVDHPEMARYHRDWGRRGDLAVVAEQDGEVVGGALCRLFTDEDHGEGYYDEETPELGVAVWDAHRGAGLGTRLIAALEQRAVADELEAMSLSVESANPARRLYRRLGYETVEVRDGDFLMLKRFGETNEDKP